MNGSQLLRFLHEELSSEKKLFNGIFACMAFGLIITSGVARVTIHTPRILLAFIRDENLTMLGYMIMLAPIGIAPIIAPGLNKLPTLALAILFVSYATMMGNSLALVFLFYTNKSIVTPLLITASMFLFMSVTGYLTRKDLSTSGNLLFMTLVGVVIALAFNLLTNGDFLSLTISLGASAILCGLTAWDVRKLKQLDEQQTDMAEKYKSNLLGALILYLDCINIFFTLLRLLTRKRRSSYNERRSISVSES